MSTETAGQAMNPSKQPSRLALFLRASAFDFVLVLFVSVGLVFTLSYGFNSAPELRQNVGVLAAVCAVLLVCLYVGAWSKRMVPFSVGLYVVVSIVTVAVVSAFSPEQVPLFVDGQINDVEGNYAVFAMVLVVVPAVVYLLSRRTLGVVVLLLVGALCCCTIQYLYRDWVTSQPGTMAALVVYAGIGALFFVQGYRQGVLSSRTVRKTSFFASFAFGAVGSVICVLVGMAVFYGIIAGQNLSTIDFRPFEDYYSHPVIEYDGEYEQLAVIDPNLFTSNLIDEQESTQEDAEGELDEKEDQDSGGGFTLSTTILNALDMDSWQDVFDAIRFGIPPSLKVLLALLPFIIIAAIVLLRRHWRTRRIKKLEDRPYAERVVFLYDYFMKRFKRLKVAKAPSLTPLEFALSSSRELSGFTRNASHTDFLGVTLLYQRAAYGAGNVEEEDYAKVLDYYTAFFKNARLRVGNLKWAFKYFWRI